jgi:hypothetical protein
MTAVMLEHVRAGDTRSVGDWSWNTKWRSRMFERILVSRAVREACKAFKEIQPQTTEYAINKKAFHDNHERLKLERLAREADAAKRDR